jgi:nitrate reductase gamma subunit
MSDRGSDHALNAVGYRAVLVLCLMLIVAQAGHLCSASANVQIHWYVHFVEGTEIVVSVPYSRPLAYSMQL